MKFSKLFLAITCILAIGFTSCEKEVLKNASPQETESIVFEPTEGNKINVVLDENFKHMDTKFSDDSELEEFIDTQEEKSELIINKAIYNQFKHIFTPSEMLTIDADGTTIVGEKVFYHNNEASYEALVSSPGNRELICFYGEDGNMVDKEYQEAMKLIGNSKELDAMEFKNSFVKEWVLEEISNKRSSNPMWFSYKAFTYRDYINGPLKTKYLKLKIGNRSYKVGIGKCRSSAFSSVYVWQSSSWVPMYGNIGKYTANNILDNRRPYLAITVNGNAGYRYASSSNQWALSRSNAPRKCGTGTESWHRADLEGKGLTSNGPGTYFYLP